MDSLHEDSCDEFQQQRILEEYQQLDDLRQQKIKELENEIQELTKKFQEMENEKEKISSKINLIEKQQNIQTDREEMQNLNAKISYIQKKLTSQQKNQAGDENIEKQIQNDSIYLKQLIKEKEKKIQQITQKMNEIKDVAAINKNLDQQYQKIADTKSQLEFVKQTKFSCTNESAEELRNRIEEKIRQINEKNRYKQELRDEILQCKQSFNKALDKKATITLELKLVDTIYRTYENKIVQQKVLIENLQNENQSLQNEY